jgi:DNA-binding GntR family transcriptional regulator
MRRDADDAERLMRAHLSSILTDQLAGVGDGAEGGSGG